MVKIITDTRVIGMGMEDGHMEHIKANPPISPDIRVIPTTIITANKRLQAGGRFLPNYAHCLRLKATASTIWETSIN